jgi:HPt (histidine-containing phosphotransfer) domain-containing protein
MDSPAAKQQKEWADSVIALEDAVAAEKSLPEIQGVNIAAGVARVDGSLSRYRELLHMFLREAKTHFALLGATPDMAELQSFTTFVHVLKSGLANIGASALSGAAAVLEQAGHNGNLPVIRDNLVSFREELAALMSRIDEATAEPRSGAGETGREAVVAAILQEALAELKAALEARDVDGMDIALTKLNNLPLGFEPRTTVADIAKHVLFGDFKKAAEAVNALSRGCR